MYSVQQVLYSCSGDCTVRGKARSNGDVEWHYEVELKLVLTYVCAVPCRAWRLACSGALYTPYTIFWVGNGMKRVEEEGMEHVFRGLHDFKAGISYYFYIEKENGHVCTSYQDRIDCLNGPVVQERRQTLVFSE
jgi:hypothetical protein